MRASTISLLLCFAALPPAAAVENDPAAELARVDIFSFGPTGFAGTISAGEIAYRGVLAGDAPEAAFIEVYRRGTPAAKAYALHGLRTLNSEDYAALKQRFLRGMRGVRNLTGCIMRTLTPEQAVAYIEKSVEKSAPSRAAAE